ncbi:MAG: hypothetical protein WA705_19665 [Candidatus Ozemobacteraceae bacterium]
MKSWPRQHERHEKLNSEGSWLKSDCHALKHNIGGAARLRTEVSVLRNTKKLPRKANDTIHAALTYLGNNRKCMNYAKHVREGIPIDSGVTEAACKVMARQQRLCASGMRRSIGGRPRSNFFALSIASRWKRKQFWKKKISMEFLDYNKVSLKMIRHCPVAPNFAVVSYAWNLIEEC